MDFFQNCKSCLNLSKRYLRTLKYFPNTTTTKATTTTMDGPTNLMPPINVRGMKQLDRQKFRKNIRIPMLDITDVNINSVLPHLKKVLFKMDHLKPVQTTGDGKKKVLLHPQGVQCLSDLPEEVRNLGLTGSDLMWEDYELVYDNWKVDEILRAILPENQEALTSYSRIGHIIHVNLKDHLIEYKQLIGEVMKDKIVGCRTVINKLQTIENTYRNFQIELLCGEPDYKVEVKENGTVFEFDFSTVYWNPRLATEHERIIKLLKPGDVLYDVFAGVGPFSIPAARKKCHVLANDLNPDSYKWLQQNAKRNKCSDFVTAFNKDGREFIAEDVKSDLLKRWKSPPDNDDTVEHDYQCHITMNLPAIAVEFLNVFGGLMIDADVTKLTQIKSYPLVHLYCFAKGESSAAVAKQLVEDNLGFPLASNLEGVHFVRNVAPNKDMYRVSFWLTEEILFSNKSRVQSATSKREGSPSDTPISKRQCN